VETLYTVDQTWDTAGKYKVTDLFIAIKYLHAHILQKSSAIAEGLHNALCQLKSYQPRQICMKINTFGKSCSIAEWP